MQTKAIQSAAPMAAQMAAPMAAPVLEASAPSLQAPPQPVDVIATLTAAKQRIDQWLDQKSEFYSRIGEMTVTRRLALRVNVVTLCIAITALAIEAAPAAAFASLATASWLTYRFNHSNNVKKGGRS